MSENLEFVSISLIFKNLKLKTKWLPNTKPHLVTI